MQRGLALTVLGREDEAMAMLERSLTRPIGVGFWSLAGLAVIHHRRGDATRVQETLDRLDASTWASMRDAGRAVYYLQVGDFHAAADCIHRMIAERNPWSAIVGTGLNPDFRRSERGRDVLRALRIPEQYWTGWTSGGT
jgi:hypothetical protein